LFVSFVGEEETDPPLLGDFFWIDLFLKKAHESFMEKY
jgi:hypothetical protein